jgi:hypothetical protein
LCGQRRAQPRVAVPLKRRTSPPWTAAATKHKGNTPSFDSNSHLGHTKRAPRRMDPKKEKKKGRALRNEPDCPGRENPALPESRAKTGTACRAPTGKRRGSGGINPPLHEEVLVVIAVVIVVVIVPIAVGVPAAIVFVPPFVFVGPAVLTGFAEFVASVFRLSAFPTMVSSSLVQLMVGFR